MSDEFFEELDLSQEDERRLREQLEQAERNTERYALYCPECGESNVSLTLRGTPHSTLYCTNHDDWVRLEWKEINDG